MGDFLRGRLEPLSNIVYQLEHDPWQEPFAHWMTAVFADSTLDWNDPRIKKMVGGNDAITTDVMEYRQLQQQGKPWYSQEWRQFVTKSYLSGTARPLNYPIGIAWLPPLKLQDARQPLVLDFSGITAS